MPAARISSTSRGNSPQSAGTPPAAAATDASVRQPVGPKTVCVLPEPVCPYASSVHE